MMRTEPEADGYSKTFMRTTVSSSRKEVIIGNGLPTVLIGERINPSGKKRLAEALKAGNFDIVRDEALAQAEADADIIDINAALFGVNEVEALPGAVQAAMEAVDIPLCIDTANPAALRAALEVYSGRPLVNSVTGEERSLASVLPLVEQYGAAVIGLTQDDEGIPADAGRRVEIARKIVERAEKAGVPRENVLIDCLSLPLGANPASGLVALETARKVRYELETNVLLAVSNVSFGMPDRARLNHALTAAVIAAGATCLIADVAQIRPAVLAADLLMGRDRRGKRYLDAFRQRQSLERG